MFSRETQALMEAAVDAIIVIDHRGRMQAVNDAAQRTFGYRADELLGENVSMLMPGPDRDKHDEYLATYLRTGVAKVIGLGRQVIAQRKDGTLFPAHLAVGRIAESRPPRFVGLLRDTTIEQEAIGALKLERDRANASLEREEHASLAQERVTRVARLTTMGEMAAGVAHELSQPLTAIATYARACERYLEMPQPDHAEMREAVREIGNESQRATKIIERLRQQVRSEEQNQRLPTYVNDLVEDLRALLEADARIYETRLHIALAPHLPRIDANSAQLQQLILNLMRNAFEALAENPPGTRDLELTTARTANGDVEIRISDNGPGVSPAISDRLFHPFYTTKKSGTGLGLTISHTIARSHGGTINLRQVEPHGASFAVCLPCKEEDVS
jgi:two-component system sensor kinase FixL